MARTPLAPKPSSKKPPDSSGSTSKCRILVVDDHPLFRKGLAALINAQPDMMICGEADSGATALKMTGVLRPDVVVTDLCLKGSNGFHLLGRIKVLHPQTRLLALSMHDESIYAERVLRAGGLGYVMKSGGGGEVLAGIRQVYAGHVFLSEKMKCQVLGQLGRRSDGGANSFVRQLSDRELEVLHLIGSGNGTRQIGEQLGLSGRTIEAFRERIKDKLNLRDGTQLRQYAFQYRYEIDTGKVNDDTADNGLSRNGGK